ncbi:PREDICTED: uncharacterized protein LOC104726018 [Camelina sativa]|uniref:tRNA-uridine aminocarboxypropyltransferase n=1 Tax=Camelina sativa TaxID=90675 RepID=A0ABM0ULX0_CAMSA|nr:PREDICTED: uncharacterized protein LOC104726018 [Camelina sativa]
MCVMLSGQMMGHVVARTQLILPRDNFADCIRCHGVRVSTKTLKMGSKRSTCPSCDKPSQLCLCKKMRVPCFDNEVSVTILQHSLERKHALNSARIARLGLKNVSVTTVFDVHDEAEFVIRVIGSGCCKIDTNCSDSGYRVENGASLELDGSSKLGSGSVENLEFENNGRLGFAESLKLSQHSGESSSRDLRVTDQKIGSCEGSVSEDLIRMCMKKHGVISNISHSLMLETSVENPSFDHILASPAAMDVLAKGFVVTKFSEGKREFELEVPPGSALLFPSEESVKINDLKEKEEELKLKNLIVLDGTWSKARRIYLENPWLKILCCHVKLEIEGTSLYKEVRRQPRAGCLSTIESIVYAMKEMGEDPEGLDNMLNVFESMVEDQRRCKDENFNKII